MSEQADLLFELGTEELPPKALRNLAQALADAVVRQLAEQHLTHGAVRFFATPRRLALHIQALDCAQPEQTIERRGPAYQAAYDAHGRATKAAQGFAKSCGVRVADLAVLETQKGRWLGFRKTEPGQATRTLLPMILEQALHRLPIPKRMRWGDSSVAFVRPVHWLLVLLGAEVVPCTLLGLTASNVSFGHRFHAPDAIVLNTALDYESALARAHVTVDFDQRKRHIETCIRQAAEKNQAQAVIDPALLDEVTALVEFPNLIVGAFEEKFLELPKEVLISSMKKHQKYFHMEDAQGRLLAKFITFANIRSTQPNVIQAGNERVIRPRLQDAEFFWRKDSEQSLASRMDALPSVLFQKALGTQWDRTQRIKQLALRIAGEVSANLAWVARACDLCKTDLLTEMVAEFPELQGVMGRYYALQDDEPAEVAQALDEQYSPRFSGAELATSATGLCLAIADRVDLIVGIFSIGQKPTGDKDPFGLRRAALGVIRMIIEKSLTVDLDALLNSAMKCLHVEDSALKTHIHNYLMERLKGFYLDKKLTPDIFEAVLSCQQQDILDFDHRVQAVMDFKTLPEAASLAAANKRVRNILKKTKESFPATVETANLTEDAEQALNNALQTISEQVSPLLAEHRYTDSLRVMAQLKSVVDRFFDEVMVMVDEQTIRHNRLALLQQMSQLFLKIADLSKLQA